MRLYTNTAVLVDSVWSNRWDENKGGIKEFTDDKTGIYINWNLGHTFVPWSNVRCVVA